MPLEVIYVARHGVSVKFFFSLSSVMSTVFVLTLMNFLFVLLFPRIVRDPYLSVVLTLLD